MQNITETSLIIRKETIYDKIRKNFWSFIFKKDIQMLQKFENLIMPKRPSKNKIIIPQEMGKNIKKYK